MRSNNVIFTSAPDWRFNVTHLLASIYILLSNIRVLITLFGILLDASYAVFTETPYKYTTR
jgi:hypothetical protein